MTTRQATAARLSASLGTVALLGGVVALIGWAANIPRLTDWFARGISMQPNTALAASLSGASLILWERGQRGIVTVLGALVGLIGAATIFEHLTDLNLGIDTLLFVRDWGTGATVAPGRMGPPAATSFALLGLGLVGLGRGGIRASAAVPWLGLTTLAIALLSFTGYIFTADPLYTRPGLTGIALQTAAILLVLGTGLVAAVPDQQPVKTLLEDSGAGQLARRALPFTILAPVVLGWLRIRAQEAGYFDTPVGTALMVLSLIVVTCAVLAWGVATVRARETALRLSERELADFFDNASVGLHWVGADGTILRANQADLDLLGVERDQYIGRHIAEFHADQDVIADILRRLAAGERLRDFPARLRCADGSTKDVLIDSSVLWEDGRFIHTRCFTRDVTDRMRAVDALKDADRRKDEFLATLAHELRNPLAPIVNSLEILRLADGDPGLIAKAHGAMDRQVRHLVRLVDDLLDISRITSNRLELRRERVDLGSVLQHAIEGSRAQLDEAGHQLQVSLPPEPVSLDADPTRLSQVFSNLLTNAARYTEPGGSIRLFVTLEPETAVITVQDTGIGIPAEKLPRVFDMFTQVNPAFQASRSGLGIGLSLVKRLVELHGGSVTAASEGAGRGSRFIVRLPVPAVVQPAPSHAAPARTNGVITPRRILVVDDNRDAAVTLAAILTLSGNRAQVAHDGNEAVEMAATYRPDLILLDIGMPGLNGHDACQAIRKEPWGRDIVIVALTGWGQAEDREKSRRAGFDGHLVKPVDPAALAGLLEQMPAPLGS
jgi:PAS domain S-box-containing protein